MLLQISECALAFCAVNHIRFNFLSAGRKLIQHRDLQISIDHQRQRARNRRGGHDQQVRMIPLCRERRPLCDTEPVLLICDNQSQPAELHIIAEQRLCPNEHLCCSGSQIFQDLAPFCGGHRASQQGDGDPRSLQKTAKRAVMLLCQQFCRSHQGRLYSRSRCTVAQRCRNCCLSGADIALYQTVHGIGTHHISDCLVHSTPLCVRRREREQPEKRFAVIPGETEPVFFPRSSFHTEHSQLKHQEFLKNQPPARLLEQLL